MIPYVLVALTSAALHFFLDRLLNQNPAAQKLLEPWKAPDRQPLPPRLKLVASLLYGLVMTGAFWLLYSLLPGAGLLKGLSFALLIWLFRHGMNAASLWYRNQVPLQTLAYLLAAGFIEIFSQGILFGLVLRPTG